MIFRKGVNDGIANCPSFTPSNLPSPLSAFVLLCVFPSPSPNLSTNPRTRLSPVSVLFAYDPTALALPALQPTVCGSIRKQRLGRLLLYSTVAALLCSRDGVYVPVPALSSSPQARHPVTRLWVCTHCLTAIPWHGRFPGRFPPSALGHAEPSVLSRRHPACLGTLAQCPASSLTIGSLF